MRFSPLAGDGAPEAGAEGTRREGSCGSRAKRGLAPKLFEEMRFIAIVVIVLILSLGLIIMITTMLSSINIIMFMIIKTYDYDDDHHDYSYYYYDSYDNYYYCFYLLLGPQAPFVDSALRVSELEPTLVDQRVVIMGFILGLGFGTLCRELNHLGHLGPGKGGGKIAKQSWSSCPNLPQLLAD